MGIKDCYKVIESKCEECMVTVSLDNLCGYHLVDDVSGAFYKAVKAAGDLWLHSFAARYIKLREKGIRITAVFDGPNVPEEKKLEQARRRAVFKKQADKVVDAKRLMIEVEKVTEKDVKVSNMKLSEEIKKQLVTCVGPKTAKTLNLDDPIDTRNKLKKRIASWEKSSAPVTQTHKDIAIKFFECVGIPCVQADGEAETMCCYMCENGYCDGVLSEDTDVIAYGVPLFVSKFNLPEETVRCTIRESLLKGMEMEQKELRDMCIMLGCDYNKRSKGVGPKTVLKWIEQYRRIEHLEHKLKDVKCLNYRRCRELLTIPKKMTVKMQHMKKVDIDELMKLFEQNGVRFSKSTVEEALLPVPLEIVNENE